MSGNDEMKRLRQIQEANAIAIQRMQNQLKAQGAKPLPREEEHEEIPDITQQQQFQQPQYQQVDPNGALVQQIINQAGQHAANQIANQGVAESQVKSRMGALMEKYPALRQDDHALTVRARDEYTILQRTNPSLDQATAYELAAANAASFLGIRPHNQSMDDYMQYDYTMGARSSLSAAPTRKGKNRLTKEIVTFADFLGIDIDSRGQNGKKNLEELNEYTERFKADRDESEFRYK